MHEEWHKGPATQIRTQEHRRIVTRDDRGQANGYLVPLYNVHEGFFKPGDEPQQVYLTAVAPGTVKGPHLHLVRRGFFTCIKGNVLIVLRTPEGYAEFLSGEDHEYLSVEIPTGIPAAIYNLGDEDALVLNLPRPAWTPDMNDEHTADFGDYAPRR
jgi:dTDP-4-dehydrorhamnose 3,5-epimerase-like enzyme